MFSPLILVAGSTVKSYQRLIRARPAAGNIRPSDTARTPIRVIAVSPLSLLVLQQVLAPSLLRQRPSFRGKARRSRGTYLTPQVSPSPASARSARPARSRSHRPALRPTP